jgi:hypothetical protein
MCFTEIEKVLPKKQADNETVQTWPALIRELLRQIELPHKGLTVTRKKEGVETVLARFSSKPEVLFEKLGNWSDHGRIATTTVSSTRLAGTPGQQLRLQYLRGCRCNTFACPCPCNEHTAKCSATG